MLTKVRVYYFNIPFLQSPITFGTEHMQAMFCPVHMSNPHSIYTHFSTIGLAQHATVMTHMAMMVDIQVAIPAQYPCVIMHIAWLGNWFGNTIIYMYN